MNKIVNNIVFTTDFTYHSFENKPTYHNWLWKMIKPYIDGVTEINKSELKDLKNNNGDNFDREYFFHCQIINQIFLTISLIALILINNQLNISKLLLMKILY